MSNIVENFINTRKINFYHVTIIRNKKGKKMINRTENKIVVNQGGLPAGWQQKTHEQGKAELKRYTNNDYLMIQLPDNIICFDVDDENVYNILCDALKDANLYDDATFNNITTDEQQATKEQEQTTEATEEQTTEAMEETEEQIKRVECNDKDVNLILNSLNINRCDKFDFWWVIMCIFKNEKNDYNIFDKWSKKSVFL